MSEYIDHLGVPFVCGDWPHPPAIERFWQCAAEDPEGWADSLHRKASRDDDGLQAVEQLVQGAMFFGFMQRLFGPSGLDVVHADFVVRDEDDDVEAGDDDMDHMVDEDEAMENDDFYQYGEDEGGEKVDDDEEDSMNSSESIIGMRNLTTYVVYWIALDTHKDDSEDRKKNVWPQHQKTFSIATRAINQLIRLRRGPSVGRPELSVLDAIILSCIILLEELYEPARLLFDGDQWFPAWELGNALRYHLRQQGWCNGEITVLHRKFLHVSSLLCLSSLDRHFLERQHSSCDGHACRADYIDESTYRTKHASKGCLCSHVGETEEQESEIMQLLEHDIVPVIRVHVHRRPLEGTRISVAASDESPYVAISHVWSDGLGNPTSNKLPQCQLRRIQAFVDALYDEDKRPVPFWIDTICVPLDRKARKKAIRMMGQTYKNADKLLVLDSWLHHLGLDDDEIDSGLNSLKVKACTWASRLWTGQEGMLARRGQLYFQTERGSVCESQVTEWQNFSYWPAVNHVEEYVGVEDDVLQERLPQVRDILIRAILRIEQTSRLWDLDARRYNPGANVVMPETDFPWERDRDLLKTLGNWRPGHHILLEGRDYLQSIRWMGTEGPAPSSLNFIGSGGQNDHNNLLWIGSSMRNRSTSRIEDEPICIATLLGQDTAALLDEPSVERRMKMVVSRLEKAPYEVMFAQVERIDEDGYRWAPRSYFQNRTVGRSSWVWLSVGEVRKEGLLVRLDGILLEPAHLAFPQDLVVETGAERYLVRPSPELFYPPRADPSQLAILWSARACTLASQENNAILVEVQRRDGDTFFSRFVCLLSSWTKDGTSATKATPGMLIDAKRHKWCVG